MEARAVSSHDDAADEMRDYSDRCREAASGPGCRASSSSLLQHPTPSHTPLPHPLPVEASASSQPVLPALTPCVLSPRLLAGDCRAISPRRSQLEPINSAKTMKNWRQNCGDMRGKWIMAAPPPGGGWRWPEAGLARR